MSIFSKVTLKTLKKNKTRTIVTVVGIILSAAMITAVTSSISSFERYLQDVMVAREGLWHGSFCYMPASDKDRLEADGRVDSAAYAQIMGYSRVSDNAESHYPYLYVLGADETFFERMPVNVTEGRLPEKPDEIVLRHGQAGDTRVKIGDTVTLPMGDRLLDGKILDTYDNYDMDEELRVNLTRTYTVVGYMSRPDYEDYGLPGQMALTYWDSEYDAPYLESWFLLKNPKDIFHFQADFPAGAYKSKDNSSYLTTLGIVRYDSFYTVLYSLGAILIFLIMFGSVSLIYNAFSISVAERTKQFGLLRSVGATKKQIRRMVFTEAVTVSAIGIPLGILSGILGMTVTFHFIGGDLSRMFDTDTSVVLHMHVTLLAVLSAAVIGFVTVLISAWVPSRRAMKISAIEAIRQSNDVSVKRREVRTSPLTYKLFGLEGAIASKHFKRNRKRYRATVVSLFMSVVLFISASSFCRYLTDAVEDAFKDYDHDLEYYHYRGTLDHLTDPIGSENLGLLSFAISSSNSVSEVSAMKEVRSVRALLDVDDIPEDTRRSIPTSPYFTTPVYIFGVEDETYRKYLAAHGLSEAEYMGVHPKVVVRATKRYFNSDAGRMERMDFLRKDARSISFIPDDQWSAVDDAISDGHANGQDDDEIRENVDALVAPYVNTYEIGYMTDELIFGLNGNNGKGYMCVLMPLSEAIRIDESGESISLYINMSDPARGVEDIVNSAKAAGFDISKDEFYNVYERTANQRALITVINVISYGFIILISAIAALNVFNTISTNVLLRRREFAMLRSVGMTNRGFNKMMNFECILYGTKSLIFGVPAAFALTYLMFRSVNEGVETSFYLPWSAVAIAIGSVFLVVFATMMYSMTIIKRDNPVEAMKNEVI